jgi:glycosyltransferase involved in cell wall biosynthesis
LLPLQAALSGCALLLSDIPSYRELWDGAAWFFRANDAADLRAQWQCLLADPDRRAYMQRRAGERAAHCYTPARMVQAYRGVYSRTQKQAAL